VTLDNTVINNRVGVWYIGIRQLNTTEQDLYSAQNPPPKPAPFTGRLTTNFTLAIYTSGCYFTQKGATSWDARGCKVCSYEAP
jgi:hypothetical protein